jgi:hypothetical protein
MDRISFGEMGMLRARQRQLVRVWLLCHSLALAAFAPCACCDVAADVAASDHCPRAADGVHCPMVNAGDGQPCPMHAVGGADSAEANGPSDCVMRGICDGAGVALGSLLSSPGVLADDVRIALTPSVWALAAESSHASFVAPVHDPPPPRF